MKYKVILGDCPWHYSDTRHGNTDYNALQYPTMKTDELCALPVKDIADKDCMLFMWTTGPMIKDCIKIMESWGFKLKTVAFVWVKLYKKTKQPVALMGQYTMSSCEFVLVGTNGKRNRVSKSVKQIIQTVRQGHSVKPTEVHKRIEELCGDVPRIELFARDTVPGWTCLGNGIDGKDIRESLEEERSK